MVESEPKHQELWKVTLCCCYLAVLSILALVPGAQAATVAPISISCEKEDALNGAWSGPMTVTYPGGTAGELSVTSAHVALKLPARVIENTGVVDGVETSTTGIRGSDEIPTSMPDLEALFACAAANISPDFKDDADMQAMEIANCASKAAVAASPILVNASVSVSLVPTSDARAPDVIIEIKRRYVGVTTPLGRDIVIETYPKDCKLTTQ
jgi:hypothetical protein